jgi:hypothetical protein
LTVRHRLPEALQRLRGTLADDQLSGSDHYRSGAVLPCSLPHHLDPALTQQRRDPAQLARKAVCLAQDCLVVVGEAERLVADLQEQLRGDAGLDGAERVNDFETVGF